MKLLSLILPILLTTIGCSALETKDSPINKGEPSGEITPEDSSGTSAQGNPHQQPYEGDGYDPKFLPEVSLDGKLLYQILVSEFAEKQGAKQLAAHGFLGAAESTRDPRLAKRATHSAVVAKEGAVATQSAALWVSIDPSNLDALKTLSALLLRQNRVDDARPELQKIVQFESLNEVQRPALLANLLTALADKPAAISLYDELTRDYPNSEAALFSGAHLAMQQDNLTLARERLQQLLELNAAHENGITLLSRIYLQQKEQILARDLLKSAVERFPQNHALRLSYARLLVEMAEVEAGTEQFRILVDQLPDNGDVIFALSLLEIQLNNSKEAEKQLLRLLEMNSHASKANHALGKLAEQKGDLPEAINYFTNVTIGEHYIDASYRAAQLIGQTQSLEDAIAFLQQRSNSHSPDATRLLILQGHLYEEHQQYQQAFEIFARALEETPEDTNILYAQAMVAEKIDRLDILEKNLLQVLSKEPKNAHALNALGYTLADRTDRIDEAKNYIEQAYALNKDDPAILDSLGWIYFLSGDLNRAELYLRQAAAKLEDAEILSHLAEVLWHKGSKDEARVMLQRAKNVNDKHPKVLQAMKTIEP